MPVVASAGIIGGAIGGAIVGASAGPELVDTRIFIPFGNVFSKTFESAIDYNIGKYSACYQPGCDSQSASKNVLRIKITEFFYLLS